MLCSLGQNDHREILFHLHFINGVLPNDFNHLESLECPNNGDYSEMCFVTIDFYPYIS